MDSGASVNIVSFSASTAFGVVLQSCDTKVYAFNSCDPLPVKGKFSALVESKCSAVNEFLVVESQTSLLGYATATEFGIFQIADCYEFECFEEGSLQTKLNAGLSEQQQEDLFQKMNVVSTK